MALTLTVVSRQSQSLGASATKVFDRDGGTIGRAAGNDWVLPDPSKFVSSRHANIEVVGADYFVCDMSTNGTFVNGSVEAIGYGSKVRINHGDRIQIGEYELLATMGADQPGYAPPTGGPAPPAGMGPFDAGPSPFGAPPPPPPFGQSSPFGQGPPPAFEQSPPAPPPASDFSAGQSWPPPPPAPPAAPFDSEPLWDPDPSPGAGPQDPLEIMSHRGVGGRGTIGDIDDPSDRFRQAPPSGQGAWQDSGPLDEHFAVPPASPDAQLPGGQIPADWDKTTFPRQPDPVAPSAPSSMSAPGYSAQQLPNDWDAAPEPIAPSPRVAPAMPPMPPPAAPNTPPVQRSAAGSAAGHRMMPPPPAQPAYAYPDAGSGSAAVLQRILEGAGMDPAAAQVAVANPELTDTLGQILQIFVEGMMDVLRARSDVKDTFKLQHTVMKPVENNPLKFFPNGREALAALFTKQGSGYLSPVEATRQAFDDTKAHQMAMMAGMQAAFESLMKRFDPEVLQNEFDETGHGGMFKGRNKAKYWDGLVALYAKQMRNPDDSFRRLFGEPFAEAYEEQMQRLTNVRRRH